MNNVLYEELLRIARAESTVTYSEASPLIGLSMDNLEDRTEIARLLGEIAEHENNNGRPMLTALVVHKGGNNNPGDGFFTIAQKFEKFNGSRDEIQRLSFWSNEVSLVHGHWR